MAAGRGDRADWDQIIHGYRAQVGWPGARYWRELASRYPKAKVILTVRDADDWFDSVHTTLAPLVAACGTIPLAHLNAFAEMGCQTIVAELFHDRMSDRRHAIRVFREHIAEVQAEINADRLLTFDVRAGCRPLCEFLRVPVPDAPFPWTNSSKQFAAEG